MRCYGDFLTAFYKGIYITLIPVSPQFASENEVHTSFAGLQWHCLGGYHRHLTGTDAPAWLDLAGEPRCQRVKANPLRQVYRLDFRGEQFYVKTYKPVGVLGRLKWLILGPPSRNEFSLLHTACRRQVPAPVPIAWAARKSILHPQALLITRSLGQVSSLEDLVWSAQKAPPDQLPFILKAVGRLIARLHCSGIIHHDLHAGNVLLRMDDNGGYEAYIIDLQGVKIESRSGHASAEPRRANRMANIALLLAALRHELDEAHLKIFIQSYLAVMQPKRVWNEPAFNDFNHILSTIADKHDRRCIRSRERRSLRNNRYACRVKINNFWSAQVYLKHRHPKPDWLATRYEFTPQQWQQTLSDIPALLEGGELLKQGKHNRVIAKEIQIGETQLSVVIKHIRLHRGLRGIAQALRRSRALRQWHRSFMLLLRDLPTAWPLAAIEHRQFGLLRESIFVSEKITQGHNLSFSLRNGGPLPQTTKQKYELCRNLGKLLGLLRRSGLNHRDCKASNVLIQRQLHPEGETWKPFFVDLDGVSRQWGPWRLARHQAIVRLAASVLGQNSVRRLYLAAMFDSYLRYQDLPEATNRRLKKVLWQRLGGKILKQFERTKRKYHITD